MPLFFELNGSNKKILFDDLKLVNQYFDEFNLRKEEFLKNSAENIKSLNLEKCLYVGQREFASVRHDDEFTNFIGSHDATTCHIVLIVDQSNNNCSLCHFDGSYVKDGIENMMNSLKLLRESNENNFDLYMAGGFIDKKKYSAKLTNELIDIFNKRSENFNLKLFCCSELNDELNGNIHYPIIYGLAYNIKTKILFKCNSFAYKGPDLEVRGARHFSNNKNINIYNTNESKLVIGPFDYEPIEYAEYVINQPGSFILKYFSTSPEQEPNDFVDNLKKAFKIMIEHPEPLETYFQNNQAKIYKRVEGVLEWQQIN